MAPAVELGLGARAALSVTGRGRVIAVFARAAYLRTPAGLLAITTPDVPCGPLHARTPLALAGMRPDDDVLVSDAKLRIGAVTVGLAAATTWTGRLPAAAALSTARWLAERVLRDAPPSAVPATVLRCAIQSVRDGDLDGCAACLGGVGPGLTPAGDDCLAGILLAARLRWGPAATGRLVQTAATVPTNDIAVGFLHWAARGQSIEPVHRFLGAVAAVDAEEAARALRHLLTTGHSSGADLALGLRLGLGLLPPQPVTPARRR